ncbi:MAG: anti-sigma factor [Casimicrobiaceae bacterium]
MNYRTPQRADALAAQYVLGTLSSRARTRFAKLAAADHLLGNAVRAWEERLLPFAESIAPVAPPAQVWPRILARIQRARAAQPTAPSLWANLGLWRGLTLAGFATALALSIVLLSPPVERPEQNMVAVLAGPDTKPVLIASAERGGRTLLIKPIAPLAIAADKALELWALPEGGTPRSLGLISPSGIVRVALPQRADAALARVPALAVSLEPAGGSTTGLPTGPVLYSGAIQQLF